MTIKKLPPFDLKVGYEWMEPETAMGGEFAEDQYWLNEAKGPIAASSLLTTTRSSGIVLPDSAGVFQTLGNDTLPRTDSGLYANGQAQNQIRNPRAEGATVGVIGSGGAFPINWSALFNSANLSLEVVGVGEEDGAPGLYLRVFGTPTSTTPLSLICEAAGRIAGAQGQTWTASAVVLLTAGSLTNFGAQQISVRGVNAAGTGTIEEASANLNSLAASAGAGRVNVTKTFISALTERAQLRLVFNVTSGQAVDATLFVGIPHLVQQGFLNTVILPPVASPGVSTLFASDIRAVQGTRPSNAQPEPFPGWEAAGLDDAVAGKAVVNIDRLSAANNRTIFQVGSENEFARLDFTTGNRFRMTLQTLGPELVSNSGSPFVTTTGWTQQQGIMSVVGGKLRATRDAGTNGRATIPITCVIGATYRVVLTGVSATATGAIIIANSAGSTAGAPLTMTSNGAYTFVATQTTHFVMILASNGADGTYVEIGGISTKEVKTLTLESGVIGSTGLYDISARLKPGDHAMTVSGGIAGDSDSSSEPLPTGATTLRVGSDIDGANPYNGWIKNVQVVKVE